jgi:hypothetical protein
MLPSWGGSDVGWRTFPAALLEAMKIGAAQK